MIYTLTDFEPVGARRPRVKEMHFFCPGCNSCPDDFVLPSIGCPCAEYANASGSLTILQVARYLADHAPIEMP